MISHLKLINYINVLSCEQAFRIAKFVFKSKIKVQSVIVINSNKEESFFMMTLYFLKKL